VNSSRPSLTTGSGDLPVVYAAALHNLLDVNTVADASPGTAYITPAAGCSADRR